eukprot:8731770-Pyramimonas_sp.AAC.1
MRVDTAHPKGARARRHAAPRGCLSGERERGDGEPRRGPPAPPARRLRQRRQKLPGAWKGVGRVSEGDRKGVRRRPEGGQKGLRRGSEGAQKLSLIHISEPTRPEPI